MSKPKVLFDPHWRSVDELFSSRVLSDLTSRCEVIWGRNDPMPRDAFDTALSDADILITTAPVLNDDVLDRAPKLRMVIEVEGAFPASIDYPACAARGVEVLCCAPGFRQSVAEMGLAMALAGARGLVQEHEAMRRGEESWLSDHAGRDFTLFGAKVGFVGFGQIAREISRLLSPFGVSVSASDPWLPENVAKAFQVEMVSLDTLMKSSRLLFITAVPTAENKHMINDDLLALMPGGALLVLLSRAHLIDFDALRARVASGQIRAAVDVFPKEPMDANDPIRSSENMILSPHRAAAVDGGRHLIGEMIRDDVFAFLDGQRKRRLSRADPERIGALAGVGDARDVAAMAASLDT